MTARPSPLRRLAHRMLRANAERRVDHIARTYGLERRPGTTDGATLFDVFVNEPYGYDVDFDVDFVIEVGANVGYASVYFARRFPNATILAIEAESSNFRLLERNVSRFERILPLHVAVSAHDGETFVHAGEGEWGFYTAERPQPSAQRVEAVSIPTLLQRFGITSEYRVLMKVNIAGFEKQLFDERSPEWIRSIRQISVKLPWVMGPEDRNALFHAFDDESLPPMSLELYKNSLVFRRVR